MESNQGTLNVIVSKAYITLTLGVKNDSFNFQAFLMVFWLISIRKQTVRGWRARLIRKDSSGLKKGFALSKPSFLTRACNSGQVVRVQIAQMLSMARGMTD